MFHLRETIQLGSVVHNLAWAPDGKRCVFGCSDGSVQLYNLEDEGHNLTLEEPREKFLGEVYAVVWSPNGMWIAASGAQGEVAVWEADTGRLENVYTGHEWLVVDLSWSPDSHCLASASLDMSVQVWEAFSGRLWRTYEEHDIEVYAVAWSPDGKAIASGDLLSCIHLWSPVTGDRFLTYREHMTEQSFGAGAEGISALAFAPESTHVASAQIFKDELGGRLLIWDAESGHTSLAFPGEVPHPGWVARGLSWTREGKVIGATLDGSVYRIDLDGGVSRVLHDPEMGYAAKLSPSGTTFLSSVRTEASAKLWVIE